MPLVLAIGWGIFGFFMIYLGQIIGVQIESALGISPGSENTKTIIHEHKYSYKFFSCTWTQNIRTDSRWPDSFSE